MISISSQVAGDKQSYHYVKHKKAIKIAKLLGAVVILYVIFPFVAGLFALGDRDGPKIYPLFYHKHLYMIS